MCRRSTDLARKKLNKEFKEAHGFDFANVLPITARELLGLASYLDACLVSGKE